MLKVLFAVLLVLIAATGASAQLSLSYPGDVGICGDSAVKFCEQFTDNIASVISRFNAGSVGTSGLSLVNDKPAASTVAAGKAVYMTGSGPQNMSLYKNLGTDYTELYVRWYVKYDTPGSNGIMDHPGVTIGGQNPRSDFIENAFCCTLPTGTEFFTTDIELRPPLSSYYIDAYTHWMGMKEALPLGSGNYYGNTFINNERQLNFGQWYGVECRIKMNSTLGSPNGELQCWLDNVQILNLSQGSPLGQWIGNNTWTSLSGSTPFDGFQWRSTGSLAINLVRMELYAPNNPSGAAVGVRYANFVAATSRIGLIAGGDTTAPSAPSGLAVSSTSSSTLRSSWTASTDANGILNYRVERCPGTGCSQFVEIARPLPTAGEVVYLDTNLSPNTVYRYRIRAADPSDNLSSYSSEVEQTTLNITTRNIAWVDNATTEDGIILQRCDGAGCSIFSDVVTLAPNTTSYQDTSAPNPTACYRAYATLAGTIGSSFSNTACSSGTHSNKRKGWRR